MQIHLKFIFGMLSSTDFSKFDNLCSVQIAG